MSRTSGCQMNAMEKMALFASLYFAQGLPYGFFTQAMPVYLRESKATLTAIGGAALLTLPWALKFLWAPLADRYGFESFGLRRSWIVPLQILSVISLVIVSFLNPAESLIVVLAAFLICNLLAATQDVSTDGLAVDLLKDSERGWANGVQVGAYRIGMIAGGSAMLVVLSKLGWQATMLTMAFSLMISSLPILFFRERDVLGDLHANVDSRLKRRPLADLGEFLKSNGMARWLGVLLVFKASHQAASTMLRPWLVDNGYSLESIGALMGLFGSGAGLVGAVLGAWVASRFDRMRSLVVLAGLQALATATYLLPILTPHAIWKIALATAIDNGISGIATVTLFAAMMERCRPRHSASDYTLQASIVVISQTLASTLSGASADFLGYSRHFSLVVVLSLFIVGYTLWAIRGLKTHAVKLASLLVIALGLSISPQTANAFEYGIGFGAFVPSRIGGVSEIMNGWALRAGSTTARGTFEIEYFNSHGEGVHYHTGAIDYRLDVGDMKVALPVHLNLGLHVDYYRPSDLGTYKTSGGWHYGGGFHFPIGSASSPISIRADFKHRFSPGSSLIVLIGFSYTTDTASGSSSEKAP